MPLEETKDLVIIIMAGGAGTRFWPVSLQKKPKQFIRLFGDQTFIQQSYERARGLVEPERILVLVHSDYVTLVAEQLTGLPEENIIAEPLRRDTAAAITLAALLCQKRFGNPVMA